MISKIKNFIFDKYIDYKYKNIINNFDKKINLTDNNDKRLNHLISNGSLVIKNIADENEINNFSKNLKWISFNNSVKHISPLVIENKSIIHKLLTNKILMNIVINYIGKHAKLDSVEIQKIFHNTESKSISEKWHYDNVGRRLKVFCYLNSTKNIFTEYLNKTNQIIHNEYSTRGSRVAGNVITKYISNIETFYPEVNSILIIDTNGYHRGVYRDNLENNNNNNNFREMIVMEFSNIKKSEMFYGTSDIIGPRDIYLSKEINLDEILLEKKYICDYENFYKYDLRFIKSF